MTMTAEIKLSKLELSEGQYTKVLFETIDTQMRQAARAWLRAIILSNRVPVWTGTAKGSLKPLAVFLRVALPIRPVVQRKGMGPDVGASQGSFKFTSGYVSTFEFTTEVAHYMINEFYNPNPPIHLIHDAPWGSFEIGKKAFREYMKDALAKKMPRISDYLLRGRVIRSRK